MFLFFSKKGYSVKSFGTGDKVKLPGTAIDKPNIYDFNCTYDEIYNDLSKKDRALYPFNLFRSFKIVSFSSVSLFFLTTFHYSYTQNGLLHMLDRNRRIKSKPEKFQHSQEQFDLIITCEERVYDQVIDC